MNLLQSLIRYSRFPAARSTSPLALDDWVNYFSYDGTYYPFTYTQTLRGNREEIDSSYSSLVGQAYKSNGVVFACMLARQLLFSEARFQYRALRSGRPGELFSKPALGILERPWPGGTTGDLLTRIIQDADLAGNAFIHRRGDTLVRLRPDWVTIVMGSSSRPGAEAGDLDAEVLGYVYKPGGPADSRDYVYLDRSEVAHFAPVPDPTASYRGMSWLTPILREIAGDSAASSHKNRFFENGATPNLVISLDKDIAKEAWEAWVEAMESKYAGAANAYKTLYLGAGADIKTVGADLRQIDFKQVQGAGETRIAAAAGVPPIIVGLSEGLQAATYSNYGQARRRFADGTMRPLWRNVAGSLSTIIPVPSGAELWYDDRDIPFLAEDVKDAAEVKFREAQVMRTLIDAGFEPKSVTEAVIAGDFSRLQHTGLYSVQLQPPNRDANNQTSPADQAGRSLAELIAPYLRKD